MTKTIWTTYVTTALTFSVEPLGSAAFHSEAEKKLFDIAKHLDVDVRVLLVSTK